jgi:hypothetical protein
MKVTLIVVSDIASLEQLEMSLGESRFKHHTIGSSRANGLVRKQTIWMRDWPLESEPIEDMVRKVLDWLKQQLPSIISIDPAAFIKISCTLSDSSDGFAVNPSMARELADTRTMLLINSAASPGSSAGA